MKVLQDLKRNVQFAQKVNFEPLMDFKQNHIEIRNFIKAPSFKSFLHLSYKKAHINLFMTVSFKIFLRQTLTDDFLGLHKNMNCAFPLTTS